MEYTGERYLPWEPNAQASYEHYHRYSLALNFASGKAVLDLASGEGYGAAALAQVAASVVGVDVSAEAVAHAQSHYGSDKVRFLQAGIHSVPLPDRVFDLITCFETIEHVHDQEQALDELARLLKDDGILLISTPNRLLFANAGKPWPWHVKEFDKTEFQDFLMRRFKDVIFLGQKTLNGSSIWPLADGNYGASETFIRRLDGDKTVFVDAHEQAPVFFLAIASNKDLGEVRQTLHRNYLLDISLDLLKEKDGLIDKLKNDVATLDNMVREKEKHLVELTSSITSQKGFSEKPLAVGKFAVCTIASKNYLGQVRVFAKSMAQSNPDVPVYVLIVDRAEGKFDPAQEPYHAIFLEELENIPNPYQMFFKYTPIELNTAAKPYFLEHLMQKFQLDRVCYFDPDIFVFSKLDTLSDLLKQWSLVLTPHILSPYGDDLHPTEIEINLAGVFNLGFIGVSNTPTTAQFLKWWQARLYDYCYMKPFQGMHVDQNWVNFAPAMYDSVFVLRDPAYNIAYWNLHERVHGLVFENNQLFVEKNPAVFFHYSGFNPKIPDMISVHQDRFRMDDIPNVRPIYEFYRDQLEAAAYSEIKQWPYAYGRFDNGVKIPEAARALYSQLDAQQRDRFGNPFSVKEANSFFRWINQPVDRLVVSGAPALTRLHLEIYNTRPDLQAAFPDPLGAGRADLIRWLQENLVTVFKVDGVFTPESAAAGLTEGQAELGSLQFMVHRFTRAIHRRLKDGARRAIPSDSPLFQKMRMFNKRYLEKGVGPVAAPPPQAQRLNIQSDLPFGVNVAGYIQGEFGVAEVARASLKSLAAASVPVVLNNVKAQAYREKDSTFAEFSLTNPYRVNLVHVNADQVSAFASEKGPGYFQNHYNIGCWFWELSSFPKQWRPAFDCFNEIWVASGFCQESIASLSPIPVVKMPFPVLMDEIEILPNRKNFGLPEKPFVFGFVFDYHSIAERKNPFGLIQAFEMAFGDKKDALLMIKTINGEHSPEIVQRLHDAAARSRANIQFIDGYLPRQDAISLVASCDSFVSLHRSEGLGIGMAQAMYLKKPVIATGYSGNMDFMNHNNSFLVRYQLAELKENYGPYEKGCVWAEPDLEHAALLMKQVYENRDVAQKIGERASVDIKTHMTPAVAGEQMRSRLQLVA